MDIHHHKLGIQDVIGFVSCLPIQQSNNYHIGRLHKQLPITWTDLETSSKSLSPNARMITIWLNWGAMGRNEEFVDVEEPSRRAARGTGDSGRVWRAVLQSGDLLHALTISPNHKFCPPLMSAQCRAARFQPRRAAGLLYTVSTIYICDFTVNRTRLSLLEPSARGRLILTLTWS